MASAKEAASRSVNACERCRKRKVKCSGERPCRSCSRHGHDCTFGNAGRRQYTEGYVQSLLKTIKQYEQQIDEAAAGSSTCSSPEVRQDASRSPRPAPVEPPAPSSTNGAPQTNGNATSPGIAFPKSAPSITDGAMDLKGSSPRSNSIVKSGRTPGSFSQSGQRSGDVVPHAKTGLGQSPGGSEWNSTDGLTDGVASLVLPTEAESIRLLQLFQMHLDSGEHFLDSRTFSDQMTLLFQGEELRARQMKTMWFLQYLLVMAMAKLMDDDTAHNIDTPGASYFAEATRRLPPIHKLGAHGVISVEIMCLMTTYLQWCDRRHDAYVYIGTGVRLAIALGYSQKESEQEGLPSERAHKVRVWWTTYMLDRRLSAALGMPAAADNRQICFDLPNPAPGFPSPRPLNTNVRIAHATGDIMTSLYGNVALSDIELVRKMQSILRSLHETGRSIPPKLFIDFNRTPLQVNRSGASLYLMLFQAVILCIRPLVMQKLKHKRDGSPQSDAMTNAASLCNSCTDAAIQSIDILTALQKDNLLARFGFFDLEIAFSAAFILVMKGFILATPTPPSELIECMRILDFLSKEGNKAAGKRLVDVRQFSAQVWPDDMIPEEFGGSPNDHMVEYESIRLYHSSGPEITTAAQRLATASQIHTRAHTPSESAAAQLQSPMRRASEMPQWDESHSDSFPFQASDGPHNEFLGFDLTGGFGPELDLEAAGIYSSFNDPALPLTGVDHLDWAEMEKMLFAPSARTISDTM